MEEDTRFRKATVNIQKSQANDRFFFEAPYGAQQRIDTQVVRMVVGTRFRQQTIYASRK